MAESGSPEILHQFVGREDFLKELQAQWSKYRIFGVFGLKSVGKTRTVEEFVKRARSKHCIKTYVYIDFQAVKSQQNLVFQMKNAFGLTGKDLTEDKTTLQNEILSKIDCSKAGCVILNFDNAEDVIESPAKDLFVTICETLIEKSTCVRIVLTSTVVVDFPGQKDNYYTKELPLLSHSDGVALLRSVTPNVKYTSTFHKIVDLCLGLPLAILMTGCELEMDSGFLSPEQMVEILTRSRMEAWDVDTHAQSCRRFEAWGRDCSYAEQEQIGPVYRNFIMRLSEIFRKRLAVLGYIPGSFTTAYAQHLLEDESESITSKMTLLPLANYHMVGFDPIRRRFNIHGIIKDCLEVYFTIENLPDVRKRYCQLFCKVIMQLSAILTESDFTNAIAGLILEHPNVQKLMTLVKGSCPQTFSSYIKMISSSSYLIEQYFGGESVPFYTQCLELCKVYQRPRDEAIVCVAYARILTNVKGDFLAGERMYRRAVQYLSTDPSSLDIAADVYQNLGWNLFAQDRLGEALVILQRAKCYQTLLGMKLDVLALATLTSIGMAYGAMGNFDEGEKYQMESINKRIQKHGKDHPHIGCMYENLGELYRQRGEYDKSSYYFQKGLEVKKQNGATIPAIIISLNSVAFLEISNSNFDEAKRLLDEAWSLLEQKGMEYTLLETQILETYGKLYLAQGRYREAIKILETITPKKKVSCCGGIGHVDSLLYFGRALERGGNPSKALQVFQEALTYKEDVAREVPQNTIIWECLEEMADILTKESNLSECDNSRDLLQVFTDGEKELLRIIGHYKGEAITCKQETYTKTLAAWKQRFEETESCQEANL